MEGAIQQSQKSFYQQTLIRSAVGHNNFVAEPFVLETENSCPFAFRNLTDCEGKVIRYLLLGLRGKGFFKFWVMSPAGWIFSFFPGEFPNKQPITLPNNYKAVRLRFAFIRG